MKKINVIITFSQSKTYKTDWKVRAEYRDGYTPIFTLDEVSKATKFGENPNMEKMREYATARATALVQSFDCEAIISFA